MLRRLDGKARDSTVVKVVERSIALGCFVASLSSDERAI